MTLQTPTPPADRESLDPLGLSPAAEAIYLSVLDGDGRGLGEVPARELGELIDLGLVRIDDGQVLAAPVRLAVERWVAEQEARISRARVAARELASRQRQRAGNYLEVLEGPEEAREASRQLQRSARTEIRAFDRAPYFKRGEISEVQESVSGAGVRYRVLYHSEALQDAAVMATVVQSMALGEDARSFHDVPMRMMIADESRAMLILPYGSTPGGEGPSDMDAVLVHPSALLDALVRTFEGFWTFGVPVGGAEAGPCPSPDHQELLRLLVTGLTDASIAREIGVSERTVHRRINRLQELLGANSRFLLGVQAARRGWI